MQAEHPTDRPKTFTVPWPARLVVLITESDGATTAYGLFDTDEEADEYIERCRDLGDIAPWDQTDKALLWAK